VILAAARAAGVDAIFEGMPRSVAQIPLFGSSPGVLADDERGRIVYTPRFVPPAIAQAWFAELREVVPWKAERRRMYDRDVDVPRLTAHFHLGPEDLAGVPGAIRQAAEEVLAKTEVPFNSVGLNFYRDGRDSVAPHNDHLNVLVEGHPIVLLSLGGTRRMTIRAKEPPRRVLQVDLEAGSLLTMSYATQLHYTHGVPKTAAPVAERISLAFRVKPPRDASSEAAGTDPYR
jgi:alkylated DNA repair dioxygenase AlkB